MMRSVIHALVLADGEPAWANSAPQGSEELVSIPAQHTLPPEGRHLLVVHNPSAETALTVQVRVKERIDGANDRFGVLQEYAVPVSSTKAFALEGAAFVEGGDVRLTNDTAVGVAGAFTAEVRLRAVP